MTKKGKSHDKKDKSHEHCLQRRYDQKLQLHNRISAPKQKKSTIFNNFYKKLEGKMKGAAIEKIC